MHQLLQHITETCSPSQEIAVKKEEHFSLHAAWMKEPGGGRGRRGGRGGKGGRGGGGAGGRLRAPTYHWQRVYGYRVLGIVGKVLVQIRQGVRVLAQLLIGYAQLVTCCCLPAAPYLQLLAWLLLPWLHGALGQCLPTVRVYTEGRPEGAALLLLMLMHATTAYNKTLSARPQDDECHRYMP